MHELFHTEDCGLSLICRCCRGPICERRLTRSDRLRVQRDLWPNYGWRNPASRIRRARSYFDFICKLFRCRGRKNPFHPNSEAV